MKKYLISIILTLSIVNINAQDSLGYIYTKKEEKIPLKKIIFDESKRTLPYIDLAGNKQEIPFRKVLFGYSEGKFLSYLSFPPSTEHKGIVMSNDKYIMTWSNIENGEGMYKIFDLREAMENRNPNILERMPITPVFIPKKHSERLLALVEKYFGNCSELITFIKLNIKNHDFNYHKEIIKNWGCNGFFISASTSYMKMIHNE
jgi:hypothetical protein